MFDRALDLQLQGIQIEGFVEEMIGTLFGRLHRQVGRAIAGHHNDLSLGPFLLQLRQKFQAFGIGQFHVQQNGFRLRPVQGCFQSGPVRHFQNFVIASFQEGFDDLADFHLIVHDHDFLLCLAHWLFSVQALVKLRKILQCSR